MRNSSTPPALLSDLFRLHERFYRSVNIRLDWQSTYQSDGYILSETAESLAKRIATSVVKIDAPRAWSLTGPFGSGKSAFALFLADLLCSTTPRHAQAHRIRRDIGLPRRGLFPILLIGERTPLGRSIAIGLAESVAPLSRPLAQEFVRASRLAHPESNIFSLLQKTAATAKKAGYSGILMVVDEFGKYLEHESLHDGASDFLVLQNLAEHAARSGSTPFLLVTILHTAFSEYLDGFDGVRRAEWQKVQGRFADVAFQEPTEQFIRLIAGAIRVAPGQQAIASTQDHIRRMLQSDAFGEARHRLPLEGLLPACIPLHPIVALSLWPIFRSKLAQNERSLFAFLSSLEPYGFQDFLRRTSAADDLVPLYRIDHLYDYITSALGDGVYAGERAKRWAEIDHGLHRIGADAPALSAAVVKAVGLLGLYGHSSGLRPSPETLRIAFGDRTAVETAVRYLTERKILIFRKHDGAYGLWEGSDVDLDVAYERARRNVGLGDLALRVNEQVSPRPLVARKHYIQTGTLRYFSVRLIDGARKNLEGHFSTVEMDADGSVIFVLCRDLRERSSALHIVKQLSGRHRSKQPRVYALPKPLAGLEEALLDSEVWRWMLSNETRLQGDPVARQEVQSRHLLAQRRLEDILGRAFGLLGHAFDPNLSDWVYRGRVQPKGTARDFLKWLSKLCDSTYAKAPCFRNELLNRDHLSSAAAAARRNLLEWMMVHPRRENLGMTGFPPEMSMYASMVRAGEFHRTSSVDPRIWEFVPPKGSWGPTWQRIEAFLTVTNTGRRPISELFDVLREPPFGLKDGPLPVLLCCVLLAKRDRIALYEAGVFVPDLRIEVFERLLRAPQDFEVQEYSVGRLDRDIITELDRLLQSMSIAPVNETSPNLLRAVKPLVSFAARLPAFTKQTRRYVDPLALAMRDALLKATDPHALLFRELPAALGVEPRDKKGVAEFVKAVASGVPALQRVYSQLLDEIEAHLRAAFGLSGKSVDVIRRLQERATLLLGMTADPQLQTLVREASHLSDRDWREVLGRAISAGLPPAQWQDSDFLRFQLRLKQLSSDFIRLEELVAEKHHTGGSEILRVGLLNGQAVERRAVISLASEDVPRVVELSARILDLLGSPECMMAERKIRLAALARAVNHFLEDNEQQPEPRRQTT